VNVSSLADLLLLLMILVKKRKTKTCSLFSERADQRSLAAQFLLSAAAALRQSDSQPPTNDHDTNSRLGFMNAQSVRGGLAA
jgi:hypothetical protein